MKLQLEPRNLELAVAEVLKDERCFLLFENALIIYFCFGSYKIRNENFQLSVLSCKNCNQLQKNTIVLNDLPSKLEFL